MARIPTLRLGAVASIAGLAVLLAGCGNSADVSPAGTVGANAQIGGILLHNVHVDNPPPTGYPSGSDATVQLALVNQADQPDTLTSVTSDVATRVEILSGTGCAGTPQPRLDLPASSPADGPGYALRLVDLRVGIAQGGNVPITLTFAHAGSITVPTPIEAAPVPQSQASPSCGGS
jgi:copper(I)-binding protein